MRIHCHLFTRLKHLALGTSTTPRRPSREHLAAELETALASIAELHGVNGDLVADLVDVKAHRDSLEAALDRVSREKEVQRKYNIALGESRDAIAGANRELSSDNQQLRAELTELADMKEARDVLRALKALAEQE